MNTRWPPPNVVIGGGLYGCMIALSLAARGEWVTLIERRRALLQRASYNNQARVHGGYHYPRNRLTGRRSRVNIARFEREFGMAVQRPAHSLYAIARHGSKVTPRQFEEFCADIGTPLYQATADEKALFDGHLVAAVYQVEEPVFNAAGLRDTLDRRLATSPVELRLGLEAVSCRPEDDAVALRLLDTRTGDGSEMRARRVFNCTYSGLGGITIHGAPLKTRLKHEITEMALIEMPAALRDVGVTVMDGDFWSSLPFPDRAAHTLSHVGHTPHIAWEDDGTENVYARLDEYRESARSRGSHMILDAARYMPALAGCRQIGSLWEVKTVLVKNEVNDGRPILLEKHDAMPVWSILGGKVDNVFDLIDRIDAEIFHKPEVVTKILC